MNRKYEWTAIFLLYVSPIDEQKRKTELKMLLDDIRTTSLNNCSKLLIIKRHIIKRKTNTYEYSQLLEVTPNELNGEINNHICLLKTYTQPNKLLSASGLGKMLRYIRKRFYSKYSLLFTWGHGGIFGICSIDRETVGKLHGTPVVPNIHGFDTFDVLSNEEIAKAIAIGYGRKKLDVLMMINCLMQNIMLQYALRSNVHYLIAPEGIMGTPGYNYPEILKSLFAGKSNKQMLVECAVRTIHENARGNSSYRDNIDTWSVFAIDLEKREIDHFIERFSNILLARIEGNPSFKSVLLAQRFKIFEFDQSPGNETSAFVIDLLNLVHYLSLNDPETFEPYLKEIQWITNNIQGALPHIGNNIYFKKPQYVSNVNPCGVSIYFPPTKDQAINNNYIYDAFVRDNPPQPRSKFISDFPWYALLHATLDI